VGRASPIELAGTHARLGAQLDGILRSHQIARDGTLRDAAVCSITAAEWPTVRRQLDHLLAEPR
jgi:hypothetical protein